MSYDTVESHRCSSGSVIEIYQFGRMYSVAEVFPFLGRPLMVSFNLSKDEAYQEFNRIVESNVCDMVTG